MMGLNWGGGVYPWQSAHVIATVVVGFFALVIFVLWESFMKLKEPLMPINLFTNRGWNVATIVSGVGASMFYAFAVVWPRMVAELYTDSTDVMMSAFIASLQSLSITIGEILSGFLARSIGHVKWQTTGALTIGGVLFAGEHLLRGLDILINSTNHSGSHGDLYTRHQNKSCLLNGLREHICGLGRRTCYHRCDTHSP